IPIIGGPAMAPPEELRAAVVAGPVALETLAEKYPRDTTLLRELAFAYDGAGRPSEALGAVRRLAEAASSNRTDVPRDVVPIVMRAAARFEVADEAFRLLEESLGVAGVEGLLELTESKDA